MNHGFTGLLEKAVKNNAGTTNFGYYAKKIQELTILFQEYISMIIVS